LQKARPPSENTTTTTKMAKLAALLLCVAMAAVISSSAAHGARTLESTEEVTVSKAALSPTASVELDDDPAPDAVYVVPFNEAAEAPTPTSSAPDYDNKGSIYGYLEIDDDYKGSVFGP
jgi:uncharacterized membrane-anchored protein